MGGKKLKREIAHEALARLEEAARTEDDFKEIIATWNRLDANRERKERLHEVGRSTVPMEWGASADSLSAASSGNVAWWEMMRGNFFDMIYDCPDEIHQLVEDADISRLLENLSDSHKEFLYQYAVCLCSCEQLAQARGQTERNVRKTRAVILNKLRSGLLKRLVAKDLDNRSLTYNERMLLQENGQTLSNSIEDNRKNGSTDYEGEVNDDRLI